MDYATFHERLRWARARRFAEAKEAAEAIGVPVGTYGNHEAGSRLPRGATIAYYAKAFRVNLEWLAYGVGRGDNLKVIPVAGRITYGNVVTGIDNSTDDVTPIYEAEVSFAIHRPTFALDVADDGMYPRYDKGDLILFSQQGDAISAAVGSEALVILEDNQKLLKRISSVDEDDLLNLDSHNSPNISSVKTKWVSRSNIIVKSGSWLRLEPLGVLRAIRLTPSD